MTYFEWNNGITKIFELEYWNNALFEGAGIKEQRHEIFQPRRNNGVIEQPGAAPACE